MKRWAINFNRAIREREQEIYYERNEIRERWKIIWK